MGPSSMKRKVSFETTQSSSRRVSFDLPSESNENGHFANKFLKSPPLRSSSLRSPALPAEPVPKSPALKSPALKSPAIEKPAPSTAEERIPRMSSVAPCVFVPLDYDITQPREPPRNRIEKLERMIAGIEKQRPGVLENIAYMAERERLAILQDYGEKEAMLGGPPTGPGPNLHPSEVDWMMANMAAAAPAGVDLNVRDDAHFQQIVMPYSLQTQGETPTLREMAAKELLKTVDEAVRNSEGYEAEVEKRIGYYANWLEKEKKTLKEVGKRPEEREKNGL